MLKKSYSAVKIVNKEVRGLISPIVLPNIFLNIDFLKTFF